MSKSVCIIIGGKKASQVNQQIAALSADRYVILEGDERAVHLLHQSIEHEGVIVEQAFVSCDGKDATYYQLNASEFNSLTKPTGLLDLFPSLKLINEDKVGTARLSDVISKYCEGADSHTLVINECAQTNELLTAFLDIEESACFERIEVSVAATDLHNNRKSKLDPDIEGTLLNWCFKARVPAYDMEDPDFSAKAFELDHTQLELRETIKALKVLEVENRELSQRYENTLEALSAKDATVDKLNDVLKEKEEQKEQLALQNVNLVNKNHAVKQQNALLQKELDKIEIQMELLKELFK